MSKTDAFILTLAYPETVVMLADEWYSRFLRFIGVGKKNYLRAGHAALVLIDKETGVLEYHDFGRYITPEPNGRMRGRTTDGELHFPIKAEINDDVIVNLDTILEFLATQPKLTHGEGNLIASVCNAVNYDLARNYIDKMQQKAFVRYAAFAKEACNCARFVTDAIIAATTDITIKKKLESSKWFTPSTIGTVVIADTENYIYQVSDKGVVTEFKSTVSKENRRMFLDSLKNHTVSFEGTLYPKHNDEKHSDAQWLSGIAAGAWFELYPINDSETYRFRRVSPNGNVDVDGIYKISNTNFDMSVKHQFVKYSNCLFFHVEQNSRIFRFDYERKFETEIIGL